MHKTLALIIVLGSLSSQVSSDTPPPVDELEGLTGPRSILYVQHKISGHLEYPIWVSAEALTTGEKLNRNLLHEHDLRALDYFLSRPENPETKCTPVDVYWDTYGQTPTLETAEAIVRLRIVHSEPGFGWGAPGTLFRGKLLDEIEVPNGYESRKVYDFFAAIGQVPTGQRILCPEDQRFPSLEVGDEVILFVGEFFAGNEKLVVIGDGGYLTIRDGKILPEGKLYKALDAPEDLESVVMEISRRRQKR